MGLEAAKIGTDLVGMGVKAQKGLGFRVRFPLPCRFFDGFRV